MSKKGRKKRHRFEMDIGENENKPLSKQEMFMMNWQQSLKKKTKYANSQIKHDQAMIKEKKQLQDDEDEDVDKNITNQTVKMKEKIMNDEEILQDIIHDEQNSHFRTAGDEKDDEFKRTVQDQTKCEPVHDERLYDGEVEVIKQILYIIKHNNNSLDMFVVM